MNQKQYAGIFIAEGSSDLPLAEIVESLFFERGVSVHLSAPDYSLLPSKVKKDIESKLLAGVELMGQLPDIVVIHRDSDNAGSDKRRDEISLGASAAGIDSDILPIIPIRMTEAWLLLDEAAIRIVAGNPSGRIDLNLPKIHEVESKADPKHILRECLLRASNSTGRRRKTDEQRFNNHRRQLLERLNPQGSVSRLSSWQRLLADIDEIVGRWMNVQD